MIIRRLRKAFNAFLTGALGAFGFSSCLLAMYGVPEVFVDVTGQVTDSTGRPLKDIVVSGNTRQGFESVNTDENGRFHIVAEAFSYPFLFLRDPSTADGCFMPDTVKFEYENERSTGSWTSKAEAHDLQVIMREGTLDEYRATYDIIGSWTEIRIADDGGRIVWRPSIWTFYDNGTFTRGPLNTSDDGNTMQADEIEGTYTYEYRTLKTNLDADSLVYDVNYYRSRAWRQGNDLVIWTPSFVHFKDASLDGYFHSYTPTADGRIEESVEPGYYSRIEYKNGKLTKYESIEGRRIFTPNTDDPSQGTITYSNHNGTKKKQISVVSVSQYGFAAGERAPYQIYVREE